MTKKIAIIFCLLLINNHCNEKKDFPPKNEPPRLTAPISAAEERRAALPIASLAQFMAQPVEDFPMRFDSADAKQIFVVPGVSFLAPQNFTPKIVSAVIPVNEPFAWKSHVQYLTYKDIQIEYGLLEGITLDQYITLDYPDSGAREKFRFIKKVSKILSPRTGYFVDGNFMGDRELSILLDGGVNTHRFSVMVMGFHPPTGGPSGYDETQLKKILFSIKIPSDSK